MNFRIIFGLFLLSMSACQMPQQQDDVAPTIEYIHRQKARNDAVLPTFDYDSLTAEIENYFLYVHEIGELHHYDLVRQFYDSTDFHPHWINIFDTLQNAEYLRVLASADAHGLSRNTYHYAELATNLENLLYFYFETGQINYQLWAESEILLSDGLILLAKHLKHGIFKPLECEDYYYFIPAKDTVFEPFGVFDAQDLAAFFDSLIPQGRQYRGLQNEYAKRLQKPENERTRSDLDTLNTLRINMERWRWNSLINDSVSTVYVNIAAFRMYVFKGDSTIFESKTCVGMKRPKSYKRLYDNYLQSPKTAPKPLLHETPMLQSTLDYLVLNPQWFVPNNIAKYEILPQAKKNLNYLADHRYQMYSGNTEINPYSIDWQQVTEADFPKYRFVQNAGNINSLGKIKFMFPNKFSVYLHDTPSKHAFSRRNRAVSHGCVRVENYLAFTHVLLTDMPQYTVDSVRSAIGLGRKIVQENEVKPQYIFFKTKLPIVLDYKTAWIDESGHLQVFADVYERDFLVLAEIGD